MQIIGGKIIPVNTICSYVPTFLSQTQPFLFISSVNNDIFLQIRIVASFSLILSGF